MKTIIALCFLLSSAAQAAMPTKMYIVGQMEGSNGKIVTIKTPKGSINVPRATLINKKLPRDGQKTVAIVSWAQLVSANP